MTTRWRPEFHPDHLYFVTTTAVDHMHIFRRDIVKRILVDALYYVSLLNRTALYAFAVMPNHIHVIIQGHQESTLRDWARGFKASTAQFIIRLYQVEQNESALAKLAAAVARPDKQKYKIWEDGYFAENVFTPDFLRQKLDYVHNNPIQPHWQLAEAPEEYAWSSARFYHTGEPALIKVKDARELLV